MSKKHMLFNLKDGYVEIQRWLGESWNTSNRYYFKRISQASVYRLEDVTDKLMSNSNLSLSEGMLDYRDSPDDNIKFPD